MSRNDNMLLAGFENTLNYACATHDLESIKNNLVDIKMTILNKKCSHFGTPLHIACEDGNMDIVKMLIEAGADLEIRNTVQETPFLWALDNKHEDVALYLLKMGANIKAVGCKKETALFISASKCSGEMTRFLIDKGLDVNQLATAKMNALEWTTNSGNVEGAKALLENGIDIEYITPTFWWACRRNHKDLAEFLLNNRADISCVYKDKCELLIYICSDEYVDVVKLLVDNNIDFGKKIKYNKNFIKFDGSPLDRAIELRQKKILEVIRSK